MPKKKINLFFFVEQGKPFKMRKYIHRNIIIFLILTIWKFGECVLRANLSLFHNSVDWSKC